MEVQFGPNSIDEPNLLYKLQRKIKVFNTSDPLPNRGYNLVTSSSKYGLVFVAIPDGTLTVYQLNQLIDKECEPQHLTLQLQELPTHISVSCDYELLAVTGGQLLSIYKVADFQNSNVSPAFSIRTEVNPGTFVSALQWNPCIPDSIAIAYYDGTLLACLASSGQMKKVPSKARCICWSPKGKQLVTGNNDGTLIQYKPDLTAAKIVPAPNLFEGSPVEAMAIYWISTFQFAVVYKNKTDNSRPAVTIINTPKAGQSTCQNYEDICYSMGSSRPWFYYLQGLPQWNIIMTSSSNSMEIGSLGSADGVNWVQWCQTDEARPELPLTDKKIENYPVGISIDTCAIHQLPWGENDILPHMPLLHVVSQSGLLIIFNIINFKKDAMQVCSPPQPLPLPAHAMSSVIPGEVPVQPTPAPAPAPTPKPEPVVSAVQQALLPTPPQPQPAPAQPQSAQFGASNAQPAIKIPSFTPQTNLSFAAAPTNQIPEQKPVLEIKPAAPAVSQPQPTVSQPKAQAAAPKPLPPSPQSQENAALKAEQEKINKAKANQELKNMLVKEVNDFQMELYNFMLKTRETQAKLQRDIETINANFNGTSLDTEKLKKECSLEELRGVIVQLKLELVRACAVVAEARSHADAKDLHQWTQADPLTTKRVASVKKLAYYVQTQLEQAHKALDYKWNELASKDPHYNKPTHRMIRPVLDDVYQPLVKQQEILARQEAVIRTLKNTLNECDIGPVFKSTSLLRSTPFRNNKDPLSKLTKNILNMSIEPQNRPKQPLLSAQKLDALRDVLSNHKTVKIKPVNVELRQHLAAMRRNYEKSIKESKEKEKQQFVAVKTEPITPQIQPAQPPPMMKIESKLEPLKHSISAPAFTPTNMKPAPAIANVARTLFTEDPEPEPPKPQAQVQRPPKSFGFVAPTTVAEAPVNTKSVLKDILTSKHANLEAKTSTNLFMGQNICSPTAFGLSSAPTPASAPSAVFTSKPIVDINNMFNQLPQNFAKENKPALNKPTEKSALNVKSSETGEEEAEPKPFDFKPKDKPLTNIFALKTPLGASTPLPEASNSKSIQEQKAEPKIKVKSMDKLVEKTKENVPEKSENVPKAVPKTDSKDAMKPLSLQTANKGFVFGASQPSETPVSSSTEAKQLDSETSPDIVKISEKSDASTPPSIFANSAAAKPQSASVPKTETLPSKQTEAESKPTDSSASLSTSSIFGTAVASQPKSTASIFSSATSIFTASSTTQDSVFSSKPSIFSLSKPAFGTTTTASSIFGQTSTTESGASPTAASVFASANSQPSTPTANVTALGNPPVFGSTYTIAATSSIVNSGTTTPSLFGKAVPSTLPSNTTVTESIFSSGTSPTETQAAAAFGKESTEASITATESSSIFGSKLADTQVSEAPATTSIFSAAATTASVFASAATTASIFSTATTQPSVFGQAAQSVFGATTQASIFGGAAGQPSVFGSTTQGSVFGSPTQTTQTSLFGTPTQTTQASIFGTPSATTQASIFGTPTQPSQSSLFGTATQSTQASVFGTTTQTTQASVFGTPTQTSQASVFGAVPSTQASIFGTPTQTTQASVFGTTQTSQASIFGQPASTQAGSLFGEANMFAAASISTTSAPSAGSGGNIFGGSTGSVFGAAGTNVFGGKSTYGQNSTASNIFGGSASFGQKSESPAASIWGTGNTTGGFGSSGFGQQATTQASSIFGGTTGGSFSQPSAGAFGAQPQQSAFGSPQQQQQSPAFGGSPVFGSKPVFGQPSGFGSPTSAGFGSPATFGGFNKSPGGGGFGAPAFGGGGFGGSSPGGGGFGSPTQSNATFENLATQNTLTFGNLAQQSGPPQQAAPSFNTAPSFTGWRG